MSNKEVKICVTCRKEPAMELAVECWFCGFRRPINWPGSIAAKRLLLEQDKLRKK